MKRPTWMNAILFLTVLLLAPLRELQAAVYERPWTPRQAWDCQKNQPWLVGFNYVPSTAANTTEWWQRETFDPKTIDRELGWAGKLGFNTTRCFLQYLVWKHDP
jgi:hypothetical protein